MRLLCPLLVYPVQSLALLITQLTLALKLLGYTFDKARFPRTEFVAFE